jgi:hypothetical protein
MTVQAVSYDPDDDKQLWGEFYAGIDDRLNKARPARSNTQDRDWLQPVIGWAANHIPNEMYLVRTFAEREVHKREGDANRKANALLKQYATGQMMLTWADLGPLPFTIDDRAKLRVRYDAATPEDLEAHARFIRGSARRRYDAELVVADTLDDLARVAREAGYSRVALIGDMPVR